MNIFFSNWFRGDEGGCRRAPAAIERENRFNSIPTFFLLLCTQFIGSFRMSFKKIYVRSHLSNFIGLNFAYLCNIFKPAIIIIDYPKEKYVLNRWCAGAGSSRGHFEYTEYGRLPIGSLLGLPRVGESL